MKTSTDSLDLTLEQRRLLVEMGDNIRYAIYQTFQTTTETEVPINMFAYHGIFPVFQVAMELLALNEKLTREEYEAAIQGMTSVTKYYQDKWTYEEYLKAIGG